jgi:hypothetical protein
MSESATFTFPSLPGVTFIATRGADGEDARFIRFAADTGQVDENGNPVAPAELAGFLGP